MKDFEIRKEIMKIKELTIRLDCYNIKYSGDLTISTYEGLLEALENRIDILKRLYYDQIVEPVFKQRPL